MDETLLKLPLVVIDIVKGDCNPEYEHPQWNLHYSKVRKILPRLNNFAKKHRDNGAQIIWIKPTPWT
ncbi:hypothetical protein IH574_00485, partial [Candidatus Bathyarchaeota archaeon]|nr:hypothetical protein [Candidatus Bathyarchaeota archaeon]